MKTQLYQYQLDNMTLLDVMMNTLSAAEKLVFRSDDKNKKYAYYDEGNSASWKDVNQLVRELQIQKECFQSMIQLYHKNSLNRNFEFPCNLSKEEIITDLKNLRDLATKKYNSTLIHSIYNDIIKLINSEHCSHYTIEQIYSSGKPEITSDLESTKQRAKKILETKEKMIIQDQEHEKEIMDNGGQTHYYAQLYCSRNLMDFDLK